MNYIANLLTIVLVGVAPASATLRVAAAVASQQRLLATDAYDGIQCPPCRWFVSKCALNATCHEPLEKLLRCEPEDSPCQLDVFVEYGQWNTHLENVLRCFATRGCIRHYDDIDVLKGIPIEEVAEGNVTDVASLQGIWWQVAVTNDLDNSACTFSNFEFDTNTHRWVDNQTMEVASGKVIHALPPVDMVNGNGTWMADYSRVGWQQIENFTIVSKPLPDYMLAHYCGIDVLLGQYCGEIVFSRTPTAEALPEWAADIFRTAFSEWGMNRTHKRGYDAMIHPNNLACDKSSSSLSSLTSSLTTNTKKIALQPRPWPNRFQSYFSATYNFEPQSRWKCILQYDYLNHRMIVRHERISDGLSCSYLFPPNNGTVKVAGNGRCCADTKVNPLHHPTDPNLFHDHGRFMSLEIRNKTSVAMFRVGTSIKYGISPADGTPLLLESLDFHGNWTFESDFDTDADIDFSDLDRYAYCDDIPCDYVPPPPDRKTNNCFFSSTVVQPAAATTTSQN